MLGARRAGSPGPLSFWTAEPWAPGEGPGASGEKAGRLPPCGLHARLQGLDSQLTRMRHHGDWFQP